MIQPERDVPPSWTECHGGGQARVDLRGDGETSLGGDKRVGLYRVRTVVRRQLTESQIALCKKSLLNTTVTISMEREVGGIQAHVLQPILEPQRELVPHDRSEASLVERSLEDRDSAGTSLSAVNPHEFEDGGNRTQSRIGGGGQRNLVDSLPVLVVLGLRNLQHDALGDIVVKRGDVLPAEHHLKVQLRGGFDQIGAPQHTKVINQGQRLINLQELVVCAAKM